MEPRNEWGRTVERIISFLAEVADDEEREEDCVVIEMWDAALVLLVSIV